MAWKGKATHRGNLHAERRNRWRRPADEVEDALRREWVSSYVERLRSEQDGDQVADALERLVLRHPDLTVDDVAAARAEFDADEAFQDFEPRVIADWTRLEISSRGVGEPRLLARCIPDPRGRPPWEAGRDARLERDSLAAADCVERHGARYTGELVWLAWTVGEVWLDAESLVAVNLPPALNRRPG